MTDEDFVDRIRTAAEAELGAGPMPMHELARRLLAAGHFGALDGLDEAELCDELDDILLDTDDTWTSEDGRVALTSTLLDGAVLTHRLSESEVARGVVDVTPDLVMLDFDLDVFELVAGGKVECVFSFDDETEADDEGSFFGPAGWLDGFQSGDLLGFRRLGDRLEVSRVDAAAAGDAEVAALEAAFKVRHRPELGEESTGIVLDALCANATLFRTPTFPVGELLERAGLEQRGGCFGLRGEGWQPPAVRWMERKRDHLREAWSLEQCCDAALDVVLTAWRAALSPTPGEDALDLKLVARALAHGGVAPAFGEYVLDDHAHGNEELRVFAAALAELPGVLGATGLYLRALDAERDGRTLDAEADFHDATRRDPSFAAASEELAWYLADRGDAGRAASLLRSAGVPADHPELEFLTTSAVPTYSGVGRNDSCPCGSGRKFKVCCQREPKVPIERRTGWLGHKLSTFALRPQRRERVFELEEIAASVAGRDDVAELGGLPFFTDLAIFEAGAIDDFLDERAVLLPADEKQLLELWSETTRRLWEITATEPGHSLTLRDTRTGEDVIVTDATASRSHGEGEYVLARVVPAGAEQQFTGAPMQIELRHREMVMDLLDEHPDAVDFAVWFGRTAAPPHVTNREGEELMLCRAVLRPTELSWLELAQRLDDCFGPGDEGVWTESFELDDCESIIRGFLRRDDDALVVESNSVERADRLVSALRVMAPDLEVVADERMLPSEGVGEAVAFPGVAQLEASPDARAALEEVMRAMEDRWVDESVPALGGLTPRQAKDDPTRREDLLALLHEFEQRELPDGAPFATFDVARLRAKLGL